MENTGFVFGAPNLRTPKVEKYPDMGVITLEPIVKEGGARRLLFNPKAIELLGINTENELNRVAFSFPAGTTDLYIANTSNVSDTKADVQVKKNNSISDKTYHESIKRLFGFDVKDDTVTFELHLATVVGKYNNQDVYKLEIISEVTNEVESTDVVVEETPITEVAHEVSEALVETTEEVATEEVAQQEETPFEAQSVEAEVLPSNDDMDFLGSEPAAEADEFPNF